MHYLDLPFIPERTTQPRNHGLTMVMDKGLSLRETEDFISKANHVTDIVKLGFGTSLVSRDVKEKIKLYQDAGFIVYLGGTLFEAYIARNQFEKYVELITNWGLKAVEVSDGSIYMPHAQKCEYIKTLAKDFKVLSEVGSKDEGIHIAPSSWIKQMQTELDSGSWKVIAEARESGNVGIYRPDGTAHTVLVNRIKETLNPEDILWEAPQKQQQIWFIELFGANVNLGNIAPAEVISLETLRIGLRSDTFFNYLPESIIKQKKLRE